VMNAISGNASHDPVAACFLRLNYTRSPEGEDLMTIEFGRLLAAEIGSFVLPRAYTLL
jgi:hypothetical protein